jgi:aarF domain-containing kinase
MQRNRDAFFILLLPILQYVFIWSASTIHFVTSSHTNTQLPTGIHPYLANRVPKYFQRQRKSVATCVRAESNSPLQYPWRRAQHVIGNRKQSSIGSVLLIQSATKFLASLPHKRYICTGVAAYYLFHKVRTSEPIQRSIYFWTRAGPIVFQYKLTKWWFVTHPTITRMERDIVYERLHNKYAPVTYQIILHLRGLYVKMGQILSSRPDFMPIQYIQYFTKLQDSIPAIDTNIIRQTAIDALERYCPDAFSEYDSILFDPIPLGSASIGQVHRAVLHRKSSDNADKSLPSQEVAIKVMHTNAKQKFQTDFQVFRWLCRIAIPSWLSLLNALEEQVMTEFNYRNEAQSLQTVRDSVMHPASQYRHRVCVPQPIHELCCENVLVMEMLHGKKLIDSIRGTLIDAFQNNTHQVDKFLQQRHQEVLIGTVRSNSYNNNNSTHHQQNNADPTNRRDDQGGIHTSFSSMSSSDILHNSVGFLGKIKLLFLLQQCRNVIDLLVDVHGYQIFHRGKLQKTVPVAHMSICIHFN